MGGRGEVREIGELRGGFHRGLERLRGGAWHALDVACGFPGGEDSVVSFVNAAENGVEGLHGALARSEGAGDGGGGSGAFAEGGALFAFRGVEGGGHLLEIGGGVGGVAVGFELVVEGQLADGGGHRTGGTGQVAVGGSVGHAEAVHHGGVGGFLGDGRGGGVDVAEFLLQILAEDALVFGFLAVSASGLDGLSAAKIGNGRAEALAGLGEFGIDLGWRLVREVREACGGIFVRAEKCLGLVLLATFHIVFLFGC